MLFIAESTYHSALAGATRSRHREWVGVEMARGRLLLSGVVRRDAGTVTGHVILRTDTLDAAVAAVNADPAIVDGVAEVTRVVEYEPHVVSEALSDALSALPVISRA